ncbi:DUF883 domain-containing protein [Bacteriovorax stolpii]|uniref:Uncharacterized protein n=1 Tax=Bacteriovorax stolpii TaxID=960 RepID=A0A2K9NPY0_BACTC|nr:DUF883 C-terminal domain-containing protein [Bacteriovorax stolpii]AUN97563.1 hypothetical protein C0V70_05435 [Bacteriovorax stolpii]QDK42464.1 DUF883 domain-containing protein [Bacteriovorax stolpii]TDP52744.1 uncharacterized protein DUF883 [Bacteriovorax stolpii]
MDHKDLKNTLQELPGLNRDQLQDIEERLSEIKDRTTEFVQKHPLTSIAIAAGIGFIIGKLFSGRRS